MYGHKSKNKNRNINDLCNVLIQINECQEQVIFLFRFDGITFIFLYKRLTLFMTSHCHGQFNRSCDHDLGPL